MGGERERNSDRQKERGSEKERNKLIGIKRMSELRNTE